MRMSKVAKAVGVGVVGALLYAGPAFAAGNGAIAIPTVASQAPAAPSGIPTGDVIGVGIGGLVVGLGGGVAVAKVKSRPAK